MRTLRPAVAILGLVTAELAAVAVLHRLGELPELMLPAPGALAAWLSATAPEDALATLLRLVALGCAWWLLATTLLYVGARLWGMQRAVAAVGWATLPAVRRLADRSVAVVLATSTVLGGAGTALAQEAVVTRAAAPPLGDWAGGVPALLVPPGAAFPLAVTAGSGTVGQAAPASVVAPPVVAPPAVARPAVATPAGGRGSRSAVRAADLGPGLLGPPSAATGLAGPGGGPSGDGAEGAEAAAPGMATASAPDPSVTRPAPADAPTAGPDTATPAVDRHRVAAGEHLWAIAAGRLADARGVARPDLPEREVHAYWVGLIEANRGGLASGDPNVVHAGEVLVLPPVPS